MGMDSAKRYRNYDRFYYRDGDDFGRRYARQARNYARQFGGVLPADRDSGILDVGCADGMLVKFLREQGYGKAAGLDVSAELLALARQNVAAEFMQAGEGEFLPAGRQWDVIFLLNVVEHIDRDRLMDFMQAVAAGLRPGGYAVVRTPNMSHVMAAGHLADDLTHCSGLTEQSLEQLARMAGFERVVWMNQFRMQNFKGKVKAICSFGLHRFLWWLRGGTRPRVVYRNLYAVLYKEEESDK